MRIAITGANGFLAGYLIRELLRGGDEVVLLSREKGMREGIAFTPTDYEGESLERIFEKDIDGIAHLASTRKVADRFSFYSALTDVTTNIYDAAWKKGIRNIVYTSSISVYSGSVLPYTEEQIAVPGNMYGLFKLTCEKLGEMYNRTKGMRIKNLRLAHLYGANENNNYMINKFFRQAMAHEQLSVHCTSVAQREMMYARDAATAIRTALHNTEKAGVYNTGSGEALTNEKIAKTICSIMSPGLSVSLGSAEETITSSYMNSDKAIKELGFEAEYSFEMAVSEIMNDMKR